MMDGLTFKANFHVLILMRTSLVRWLYEFLAFSEREYLLTREREHFNVRTEMAKLNSCANKAAHDNSSELNLT